MKARWNSFDPLPGFEQCVRFEIGNKVGVICVHNTTMGPALGGVRVDHYDSEAAMLADCARLARGMSYKNAASNSALGGGKAVINLKKGQRLTPAFLQAYGQVVEALQGKYITAPDVGSDVMMMDIISRSTSYVVCLTAANGGLGDPSPSTAHGVYLSLLAILPSVFGVKKLDGLSIVVQGYGKVGRPLAQMLAADKAKVKISEIQRKPIAILKKDIKEGYDFMQLKPGEEYSAKAEIFSPNAKGGIVNPETIPALAENYRLICGGANNQLGNTARDSKMLKKARLWYAPDFIVNAGGVARAYVEWQMRKGDINRGEVDDRLEVYLRNIGRRLRKVFEKAEGRGLTTVEAARQLAEETVADKGGELR